MNERLYNTIMLFVFIGINLAFSGWLVAILNPVLPTWILNENLSVKLSLIGFGVIMIAAIILFASKTRSRDAF